MGDSDARKTCRVLPRTAHQRGQAPKYPFTVDEPSARRGRRFQSDCAAATRSGAHAPVLFTGRRDRHRSPSPRRVDAKLRRGVQRLRRGPRLEVLGVPEDRRLCVGSARRFVAPRPFSSQWIGAVSGRPPRAAGPAAKAVLARLRCVRSSERRLRIVGTRSATRGHGLDTSKGAQATPEMGWNDLFDESKRAMIEY